MPVTPDIIMVFCTTPSRAVAEQIAQTLVAKKLAACVNIVAGVESVYAWEGKIEQQQEFLLLVKTTAENYERLEATILSLHPYDTPEIIASPIQHGLTDYLTWVAASTGNSD